MLKTYSDETCKHMLTIHAWLLGKRGDYSSFNRKNTFRRWTKTNNFHTR